MIRRIPNTSMEMPDANGWRVVTFACPNCEALFQLSTIFDENTGESVAIKLIQDKCTGCGLTLEIDSNKKYKQ